MKFTTVMKRFRRGSFLAVCSTASFVAIGTAAPIGITYVQVVTSSFCGVLHNQYDSINGLNQQLARDLLTQHQA